MTETVASDISKVALAQQKAVAAVISALISVLAREGALSNKAIEEDFLGGIVDIFQTTDEIEDWPEEEKTARIMILHLVSTIQKNLGLKHVTSADE